jgi:hypothetical protein
MKWTSRLGQLNWILSSQFGVDPRRFLGALWGLPFFLRDWARFRRGFSGRIGLKPCLHDRQEEAGVTGSEYFWQDLMVARWIFESKPARHVDVGSRVDGFVAHVASFRQIEVLDVRPVARAVPGVVFRQADLMSADSVGALLAEGGCDSLSCLHAIEHFGLGRYGDPVDPSGYERGIANLARLLKPGGTLYLSAPIGRERVEFNANWVFDPRTLLRCTAAGGLTLQKLMVIDRSGGVREAVADAEGLEELAHADYSLGVFVCKK